jgi:uncharacterized SAM-binding protein YcdF (DUF218 family)
VKRRLRAALALSGAAILLWVGGFAWFVVRTDAPPPPLPKCDGIVVLTGAAGRTEAAFRLLEEGHGDRLLISGVGPETGLRAVERSAGITDAPDASRVAPSRVTLGHVATSTRGNADEIAAWARQGDMHCLIVVTSGYHMPRALLELRRALQGVRIVPYPVAADTANGRGWRLLAEEYVKFLAAALGLSRLAIDVPQHQAGTLPRPALPRHA